MESMVFGPDQDGETVVIYVEEGTVQNVLLRGADEQQIPYEDLTKDHWTKMSEAEDRAIEQLEREAEEEKEAAETTAARAAAETL